MRSRSLTAFKMMIMLGLCLGLIYGCTSDSSNPPPVAVTQGGGAVAVVTSATTPTQTTTPTHTLTPPGKGNVELTYSGGQGFPPFANKSHLVVFDRQGAVLKESNIDGTPVTQELTGVSTLARSITVDYLSVQPGQPDHLVARYEGALRVTRDQTTVINNPPFVQFPNFHIPNDDSLGQYGAKDPLDNPSPVCVALPPQAVRGLPLFGTPQPSPVAKVTVENVPPVGMQGTQCNLGSPGSCESWGFAYGLGSFTASRNPDLTSRYQIGIDSDFLVSTAFMYAYAHQIDGDNCPSGSGPGDYFGRIVMIGAPSECQVPYYPDCNYLCEVNPFVPWANQDRLRVGMFASTTGFPKSTTAEQVALLRTIKNTLMGGQVIAFSGPVFQGFSTLCPATKLGLGTCSPSPSPTPGKIDPMAAFDPLMVERDNGVRCAGPLGSATQVPRPCDTSTVIPSPPASCTPTVIDDPCASFINGCYYPQQGTIPCSGHSMLMVGYDDSVGVPDAVFGQGGFLIQNSFGINWPPQALGDNPISPAPLGHFFLSYRDFLTTQGYLGVGYPVDRQQPTTGQLAATPNGAPLGFIRSAYQFTLDAQQGVTRHCYMIFMPWFSEPVTLGTVAITNTSTGFSLTQDTGYPMQNGYVYLDRTDGFSFEPSNYAISIKATTLAGTTFTYTGTFAVGPPASNLPQFTAKGAAGVIITGSTGKVVAQSTKR